MKSSPHTSAALLGARGGRAGTGASKRRGDALFYRKLVALRRDRHVPNTGMRHRHLNHQDFTLAAIDDIIGNGQRTAWEGLRLALREQPGIREKILRVCSAQVNDPSAQRHHFWRHYVQNTPTAS